MELHYKEFGEGPALIILHGLFGSSDNWQTQARKFSGRYKVFIIDQRNHGRSFHDDRFDYTTLTNDLLAFYELRNIKRASILGHSMGGKVAMKFTTLYPELVSKLIVADIAPRYYPIHHKEIIDALTNLQLEKYERREEIDIALSKKIHNPATRQFLLKNVTRLKDGLFGWKINLEVISKNLDKIGEAFYPDSKIENDTLFLYGALSNYITEDDRIEIEKYFTHVSFKKIENAGHWLHVEEPEEFCKSVNKFLKS